MFIMNGASLTSWHARAAYDAKDASDAAHATAAVKCMLLHNLKWLMQCDLIHASVHLHIAHSC